jgi:hypothetical protein
MNIPPDQAKIFQHPLAEVTGRDDFDEPIMNLWGSAAALTCIASLQPNPTAEQNFLKLVVEASPLVDAQALLDRCRNCEPAAVRQAIALVAAGIEKSTTT